MEYIQYPDIYLQMQNFLIGYIQNFWLRTVGPNMISVYGSEVRTNNYLESFHAQLLRYFGKHPNIWDFIQKIRILENQLYVEFIQASRHLTIRDPASRLNRASNSLHLRTAIEKLNEDGDVLSCLRRMGNANADYLRRELGPRSPQ
eukprot:XP_016663650.1 PREDICTED: uncharacterized protein LOC107884971 [Acyrthosiphon pisum]